MLKPTMIPSMSPTAYVFEKWVQLSSSGLSPSRYYHSSVFSASTGLIYIIAGVDNGNFFSDVWTYNVNTLVWSSVTTNGGSFTVRDSHSSVLDSTKQLIYIFGGFLGSGLIANDLWTFATLTGNIFVFLDYFI